MKKLCITWWISLLLLTVPCGFAPVSVVASEAIATVPENTVGSNRKSKDGDTVIYPKAEQQPWQQANDGGSYRGQVAYLLLILMASGAVFFWFWKRTHTPVGAKPGTRLNIHDIRPLGQKQFLAVAAYDDQRFLIAISPGRISLLSKLDTSDDDLDELPDSEDS